MEYLLVVGLIVYAYGTIFGARGKADSTIRTLPGLLFRVAGWFLRLSVLTFINATGLGLRLVSARSSYERSNALAVFMERMTDAVLS